MAGEWIYWSGGKCPVPFGTEIRIKRRDGSVESILASKWDGWAQSEHHTDIIAYRVLHRSRTTSTSSQKEEG